MANDFTAWNLTDWARLIHQEYVITMPAIRNLTIVRDLKDANQRRIPIVRSRTAKEVAALTDRAAESNTTEKSVDLTHQPSLEAYDLIAGEEEDKVPWSIVEEIGKQLGQNVANGHLDRFIRYIAGATKAASPDHAIADDDFKTTGGVAANATAARDAVLLSNELWNKQGLPAGPSNRTILMADHIFNALFTLDNVVRKDFGNVGGVRDLGSGEYVYGDTTLLRTSQAWNTNHAYVTLTAAKFKKDLSNIYAGSPAGKGVFAVGWCRQSLAQGFTRMGATPMRLTRPVYIPWRNGWYVNAAMVWDIIAVDYNDGSNQIDHGLLRWEEAT